MSRTYKDRPYKYNKEKVSWEDRHEEFEYEAYTYDYALPYVGWRSYKEHLDSKFVVGTRIKTFRVEKAGVLKKRKRFYQDPDDNWYKRTPSWWTREFMTVPKRAACRNWEKQAIYADDLEDFEDCPDFGRKPHVYYW
jgi:hypothetical protein